jgi:hypothetical protein
MRKGQTPRPTRARGTCGFLALLVLVATATAPAGHAASFLTTLGFEDDVDLVVAPNREFLLVPEEAEDGSSAQLTIIDLDAATGQPLNLNDPVVIPTLGFENGVDPIVFTDHAGNTFAFVPTESEDGDLAKLLVLQLDSSGAVLGQVDIALGDLGFKPDIDGVISDYPDALLFFPLASENQAVRGIVVVDAESSDGDWGSCLLVSTDGRAGCAGTAQVDWLPGLPDAVDPVAYRTSTSVRLALPVQSAAGANLLLIDFESDHVGGDLPPLLHPGVISVRDLNTAAGGHPTRFPGYETDVDIALYLGGQCGLAHRSILVPQEGPGDDSDLYLLDEDGVAQWVYSVDGGGQGVTIPGYEKGVDVVPLCGVAGVNRLVVAVENAAGSDADVLLLDPATGALMAHAEDLVRNPGLVVAGFEVGVEPVRWEKYVVVPMETAAGEGSLFAMSPVNGQVSDFLALSSFLGPGWGFPRSVDPLWVSITAGALTANRLYTPVTKDANGDASVLFAHTPPDLEPLFFEIVNGVNVGGLQTDVDIGLVDKFAPGGAFLYLPEESPAHDEARVRFEPVPSLGPHVAVAQGRGVIPGKLYFVHALDAALVSQIDGVLGLETGLDMADGRGSLESANPPDSYVTPGVSTDTDTDPTLGWRKDVTGVGDDIRGANEESDVRWIGHATPFLAPGAIHYALARAGSVTVDIFDLKGRRVRRLLAGQQAAGEHVVTWDGRDDERVGVAGGIYLLHVASGRSAKTSKLAVLR